MSSFRRAAPPSSSFASSSSSPVGTPLPSPPVAATGGLPLRGTKPFINNQTLTSSGLRELDALIGGGFLLGTLVVVEPPVFGSFGADVLRYFAAEGLAHEQHVFADAATVDALPLELSTAQKQLKAHVLADVPDDPKLTIAWQYEKYKPSDNGGGGADARFCHSFDLSKPMQASMRGDSTCHVLPAYSSYEDVFHHMHRALVEHATTAVRFVLADIGAPWTYSEMNRDHIRRLHQFLRAIRGLLARHRHRAICMMSLPAFAMPSPAVVRALRHLGDYVFELTSFAGDPLPAELSDFSGLLYVHALARTHALTCHAVESTKLGIKRDRRKLKLEHLHLPPEGSRSQKPTAAAPPDMSF
ncbi:Aste57867_18955 [Aphanomyces stellatus]|uniref:Elongator complex protein 4 n=1 Tax=Aphanomyces stellatus TaxID=120398 RepID=A0A485LDD2_9STRA|nr:hypothetical protein As57867_018891 [Aphanomyces stellatus]VFT95685.1 Aste57867_18955 [Aphanomyces stellatus]